MFIAVRVNIFRASSFVFRVKFIFCLGFLNRDGYLYTHHRDIFSKKMHYCSFRNITHIMSFTMKINEKELMSIAVTVNVSGTYNVVFRLTSIFCCIFLRRDGNIFLIRRDNFAKKWFLA